MNDTDRGRRRTAKLFRGFGDASRLAALDALRDGPRCVSEVVVAIRLSQPNASAHLACLGECGLVTRERRGKFVYYAIADKRVVSLLEDAEAMLDESGARIDRCPRYKVPARWDANARLAGRRNGAAR